MFAGRNAEAYCLSPAPVKTLPVACRASLHISTKAQAIRSVGQLAPTPVAILLPTAFGSLLPSPGATELQLKGRFQNTGFRSLPVKQICLYSIKQNYTPECVLCPVLIMQVKLILSTSLTVSQTIALSPLSSLIRHCCRVSLEYWPDTNSFRCMLTSHFQVLYANNALAFTLRLQNLLGSNISMHPLSGSHTPSCCRQACLHADNALLSCRYA